MKIYLINIGCKVNFADLSHLKTLLIEENYFIANAIEDADVVLVNTCVVTNSAAAECRQKIRKIKKNFPNIFVGVLGCYAQLSPDEIIKNTGADVVFGINEKFKIPKILHKILMNKQQNMRNFKNSICHTALDAVSLAGMPCQARHNRSVINRIFRGSYIFVSDNQNCVFDVSMSADMEARKRGFLKLQDGCDYKCSYCVVPFVRGRSRSIAFKKIPEQINKLISAGYKEIVVSGINLSDYKYDDKSFMDLIKMLANPDKHFISNDIRFRISSIEPQIIDEKLIEIIADSKYICPHFHIPLQSGCDEILKKMNRKYNTKQFRKTIELINKCLPKAFIGLDVISGFPTETDADFMETKDFILSLNISKLHCFTYSKRQGTIAATMKQVPKQIKKARTNELIELSKNKQINFNKKNIGNTLLLLPEKYDAVNKIACGHTENYLEINIKTDKKLENNFHKIIVSEIIDDKMFGKLDL